MKILNLSGYAKNLSYILAACIRGQWMKHYPHIGLKMVYTCISVRIAV